MMTVSGLTWEGCEFLDLVREDKRWKAAKEAIGGAGAFTLDLTKNVITEVVKAAAIAALSGRL